MKQTNAKIALFTLAGIATAPGFMDSFRDELSLQLRRRGYGVEAASLYPYGDWSRRLIPQLLGIFRDLVDIQERVWKSVGARATRDRVIQAAEAGHTVLLAGHSGGGVTAVQLAVQLIKAGFDSPLIVQIGSPKCPVRADLKDNVLFLSAAGMDKTRKDPVVRLGRWGGWVRGYGNLPKWKRDAHAPAMRVEIPLIGGHPDYFRMHTPYIDVEGNSNLDQTLHPLLAWLDHKLQ